MHSQSDSQTLPLIWIVAITLPCFVTLSDVSLIVHVCHEPGLNVVSVKPQKFYLVWLSLGNITFTLTFPARLAIATFARRRWFRKFVIFPPTFKHSMPCRATHKALTSELYRQFTLHVAFRFSCAASNCHHVGCSRDEPLLHTEIILNVTFLYPKWVSARCVKWSPNRFCQSLPCANTLNKTPVRVSSSMFIMVVLLCCLICVSRRSTPFRGSSHAPDAKLRMQYDLQTGKIRLQNRSRTVSTTSLLHRTRRSRPYPWESLWEARSVWSGTVRSTRRLQLRFGNESFASTVVIVHLLAAAVASATCRATSPASRRAAPRSCRSRSSPASSISFTFSCKLRVPGDGVSPRLRVKSASTFGRSLKVGVQMGKASIQTGRLASKFVHRSNVLREALRTRSVAREPFHVGDQQRTATKTNKAPSNVWNLWEPITIPNFRTSCDRKRSANKPSGFPLYITKSTCPTCWSVYRDHKRRLSWIQVHLAREVEGTHMPPEYRVHPSTRPNDSTAWNESSGRWLPKSNILRQWLTRSAPTLLRNKVTYQLPKMHQLQRCGVLPNLSS